MRRVRRNLGLLTCALIAALWLSSMWWAPRLTLRIPEVWQLELTSVRGELDLVTFTGSQARGGPIIELMTGGSMGVFGEQLPLRWLPHLNTTPPSADVRLYVYLAVPYWVFLSVLGLLLIGSKIRDEWRARRGICLFCGYQLAGISPSAPCPECGRAR